MKDALLKEIEKLNKSEKLLLVESLWDSIASEPGDVPLSEHHKSPIFFPGVGYVESREIRNTVAIVVIAAPESSTFNTPLYPGVAVPKSQMI